MISFLKNVGVKFLKKLFKFLERPLFDNIDSIKVDNGQKGLFNNLKISMGFNFLPDENAVGEAESSNENTQERFHASQLNDHFGVLFFILCVPIVHLLEKQRFFLLDEHPIVLLEKVDLCHETHQGDSKNVPFEEKRRQYVLNEIAKDNIGCLLRGKAK